MGAEVGIAINVGTPLGQRENIETLTGMLSQVIGVTTIQNDRRSLQLADYVITPKLGSYTLSDQLRKRRSRRTHPGNSAGTGNNRRRVG
jgi:NTE family protein